MHVNVVELEKCNIELVSELRLPLVNHFYSLYKYRVKCGRLEKVYTCEIGGEIIAAARLVPQQSGHFLLRNLCVAPTVRKQGVATYLLQKVIHELKITTNPVNCYCYALPHLKNIYLSLGFQNLHSEQAPEDIAETHIRNCARNRGWILMGFIIV